MPRQPSFKKRVAGKHAAQMTLIFPKGGSLKFEGALSKELVEFISMAIATDKRDAEYLAKLVELTKELQKP